MEGVYPSQGSSPGRGRTHHRELMMHSTPKHSNSGSIVLGGIKQSHSANSLPASFLSPNRTRGRRSTSSNHGSRSESPLALPPGDNLQSVSLPYSMAMTSPPYFSEGLTSPIPSVSSPSRSPYQSPAHSRSSSMTSMKSLLRDRSLDRSNSDRDHGQGTGTGLPRDHVLLSNLHMDMARDRSLDRHLDRFRDRSMDNRYHTYGGQSHRDRSLDREKDFPHMGARSLERDSNGSCNLTRSRSIDYDYLVNQSKYLPLSAQDFRHARDTLILDMQAQITELNKECATLHQELDLAKEKVSSSMNSIKTFWSPELKKERALRKEENARLNALQDQLRVAQIENKVRVLFAMHV